MYYKTSQPPCSYESPYSYGSRLQELWWQIGLLLSIHSKFEKIYFFVKVQINYYIYYELAIIRMARVKNWWYVLPFFILVYRSSTLPTTPDIHLVWGPTRLEEKKHRVEDSHHCWSSRTPSGDGGLLFGVTKKSHR